MEYTTEINITKLEVNKSDGSVYNIFYDITVTKGDISKTKSSYQRHLPVNPNAFTAYEDLTESQVKGWVNVNQSDVDILLAEIAEEEDNMTHFPDLPW